MDNAVRQRGAAGEIIVPDRLLDPRQSFVVERAATPHRFVHRECLVVVGHDGDMAGDPGTDRMNGSEVFVERGVAEAQFHGTEASLEQPLGFVGERGRRHQSQSIAVVRGNRARIGAEKPRERLAGGARECVPGGDIDEGHRHADDPFDTEKRVTLRERRPQVSGSNGLAPHGASDVVEEAGDGGRRGRAVAELVRVAGDAFVRLEVHQQQRRLPDGRRAGAEDVIEGNGDGSRANRPNRQARRRH